MKFTIQLMLAGIAQIATVKSFAQQQWPSQPQELIARLAAAEEKLRNLYVQARVTEERQASGETEWKPTGVRAAVQAWYDGHPGGKARIDIEEVLEWREGAAPFAYHSFSLSFDGNQGHYIDHGFGAMTRPYDQGKSKELGRAEVSTTAPEGLRNNWAGTSTGAAFSNFFVFNRSGVRLSEHLKAINSLPQHLRAEAEQLNGVDCIKITHEARGVRQESFWLDPSRGLAMMRYIKLDKSGEINEVRTVVGLQEVSPGLWYPIEAYEDLPKLDAATDQKEQSQFRFRHHYKAEKVLANDAAFDDSRFRISIPVGYVVKDHTTGQIYQVK